VLRQTNESRCSAHSDSFPCIIVYFWHQAVLSFAPTRESRTPESLFRRYPKEAFSLQDAVELCVDGDTLKIAPGAYNESFIVRCDLTICLDTHEKG
jgi:hypothetical protein